MSPKGSERGSTPVRKRRRREKAARPGQLLRAALEIFRENGFAATRLEDVAARAGVAKGTIYLYFPSKVALFDGAVRHAVEPMFDEIRIRLEQLGGSASDQLRRLCLELAHVLAASPLGGLPGLLLADIDRFPVLADVVHERVIRPQIEIMRRMITDGVRSGEFFVDDVGSTVEGFLAGVWMPTIARDSRAFQMSHERPDSRGAIAYVAEMMIRGISVDGGSSRG